MRKTTPAATATAAGTGPEQLRRFAQKYGLKWGDIAARFAPPVARITVFRWSNGKRQPSEALAMQLQMLTNGEVPAAAWLDPAELKRRAWLETHPVATEGGAHAG